MAYTWDADLETGNLLIDNQHKQLVMTVNSLLNACRDGCGKEEIMRTLEFLNSYVLKHFSDEERLQELHDYPDYLNHKWYHSDFKARVQELTRLFLDKGPTDELVNQVNKDIGAWLVNHIKGDDFRLAAYIRSKENGKKGSSENRIYS